MLNYIVLFALTALKLTCGIIDIKEANMDRNRDGYRKEDGNGIRDLPKDDQERNDDW